MFLNLSVLGFTIIQDYQRNNGLEGIAPQWVLVHHGHEAALDDGHRDGKLLRQSYIEVGQISGDSPDSGAECSVLQ